MDAIRKQIQALQLQQKQLQKQLEALLAAKATTANNTVNSSPFAEPPQRAPQSHPIPPNDPSIIPPPEPTISPRQPLTPEQEHLVARIRRLSDAGTVSSTTLSADMVTTLEPPPPSFTAADSQGQVVPPAVLRAVPRSTVRAELSSSAASRLPKAPSSDAQLHTEYATYHAPDTAVPVAPRGSGSSGGGISARGVPVRQESSLREGSKLVAKSLRGTAKGAAKLWFTLADKADEVCGGVHAGFVCVPGVYGFQHLSLSMLRKQRLSAEGHHRGEHNFCCFVFYGLDFLLLLADY